MVLQQIFERLRGDWRLDRKIHHLDLDTIDVASGIASFSSISDRDTKSLLYKESGELSLHNVLKGINFHRQYIYRLHEDSIDMILHDGPTKGELFQTLLPVGKGNHLIGSEHACRLDKHNGTHVFDDEHSFRTEYTVVGPSTNLHITTHYEKLNA